MATGISASSHLLILVQSTSGLLLSEVLRHAGLPLDYSTLHNIGRQLDQSALVVVGGFWALASTTSLCHRVPDAYHITTNIDALLSVERLETTKDMSRNATTQSRVNGINLVIQAPSLKSRIQSTAAADVNRDYAVNFTADPGGWDVGALPIDYTET